ncbi:hypothetical protein Q8F55_007690 [Vanrija albida]|uniref:Amino acid permease/ SLC12A domain-containing protein n=1 Tax=Vanrija albida TaxID=181172 RepID=A0ABR3PUG7_9TREE
MEHKTAASVSPYEDKSPDGGTSVAVRHVDGDERAALRRGFTPLAMLGLAFGLINSWTAMAASLPVILGTGGPVAMVYGLLVSAAGTLATGVSMAEMCHVLPMAGGQYDWAYMLAPHRLRNPLAFVTGWLACAGWVALLPAGCAFCTNFVLGLVAFWHDTFPAAPWHTFLVMCAFGFLTFVLNAFGIRVLPALDRFAGAWSVAGMLVVCATLLATSAGAYQPPRAVFAQFTNETGWPDGLAFVLGLLQSTLGLTAFDAASHMVEEMPRPAVNAPKVMVLAIALGAVTGWIFTIVLLFCLRDFAAVLASPAGPLLEIYYQATGHRAGATCLLMFNLLAMTLSIQAVNTVSSRMVMSFARDRGLGHLSRFVAPIHPTLRVPLWAVAFVTLWVVVISLIYLGSSAALNGIIASAVVFLQASYAVPIALVLVRGERCYAGHTRSWSLGRARRPVNALALAFLSLTSVCFLFPPALPVAGSSMNYAVVVFGAVLLMCGATWAIDGRRNFHGPGDVEDRLAAAKGA